jgi:hypothetical protein
VRELQVRFGHEPHSAGGGVDAVHHPHPCYTAHDAAHGFERTVVDARGGGGAGRRSGSNKRQQKPRRRILTSLLPSVMTRWASEHCSMAVGASFGGGEGHHRRDSWWSVRPDGGGGRLLDLETKVNDGLASCRIGGTHRTDLVT